MGLKILFSPIFGKKKIYEDTLNVNKEGGLKLIIVEERSDETIINFNKIREAEGF